MIGVGVKNSTSDLLIANCDEFIYYDDLVRRQPARGGSGGGGEGGRRSAKSAAPRPAAPPTPGEADRKQEAFDLIVETYEALQEERGEGDTIWGSMIKQTLKRRKPGFSESYYGFRSFSQLLEEAEAKGILALSRDEKSGGFTIKSCRARPA